MLIPFWPKGSAAVPSDTHDGGYSQYSGWKKKHKKPEREAEEPIKSRMAPPESVELASTSPTLEVFDDSAFKQSQAYLSQLYQQLSDVSQQLDSLALKKAYLKGFEENIRLFLEREAVMRAEEEEILLMLLLN